MKGSASAKNLVQSKISKKLQNEENSCLNRTLCWGNKKNVCEEEGGADGPAGDPWSSS